MLQHEGVSLDLVSVSLQVFLVPSQKTVDDVLACFAFWGFMKGDLNESCKCNIQTINI